MTNDTKNIPIIQTVAEPLQQYLQNQAAPQTAQVKSESPSAQIRAFRPTNRWPF